jgi:predicted transposase YbfD/YdcC
MHTIVLLEHFAQLPDPRRQGHNKIRHELLDIIIIAIVATVCGADTWVDIESFAKEKESWLRQYLKLPSGIPSHDTFGRFFSLLDPTAFEHCFSAWVQTIRKQIPGEVIALDGKSLRRSHEKNERPLHLVNVFATENGIVLGQRTVDGKTNEITVIPELLDLLFLEGCVVTADAMGCQGWIAQKTLEKKADCVLAVKGNQERLLQDIVTIFNTTYKTKSHTTHEKSHGREETRVCTVSNDLYRIRDIDRWSGLQSIVKVTCTKTTKDTSSSETRYFISSLAPDAERLLFVTRSHWKVETTLHWSLDMSFREDESRVRIGHAGANLSLVRKLALNLLRREASVKTGIRSKRLKAGWNDDYLLKVLTG